MPPLDRQFKFILPEGNADEHFGQYNTLLRTAIENYLRNPAHWKTEDFEAAMAALDTLVKFVDELSEELP